MKKMNVSKLSLIDLIQAEEDKTNVSDFFQIILLKKINKGKKYHADLMKIS